MPHSYLSSINVMLDEGKLTQYKKRFVIFGTEDDSKLWAEVKKQTASTNKAVTDRADSLHILQKADSEAISYIQSMLDSIRYKRVPITFQDTAKHKLN
jgi:hypothetical protein